MCPYTIVFGFVSDQKDFLIARPMLMNCNLPTLHWSHAVLHAATD
jgi:hypothetical protein